MGDGLEFRGATAEIVKTVNKHNNGKSFKITRSFLQSTTIPSATLAAELVTCAAAAQTASAGCAQAVANVDSVVISNVGDITTNARCGALKAATDGADYPMSRTITTSDPHATDGSRTMAVAAITATNVATVNCAARLARHVITLDSMPTASATSTAKTLLYTSPVGSCSVAETTKVHTKVMNVPTVVHVMVKVVYVHVTKVTPANPAKHKQFWFKFAKKTS